MLVVYFVSWTQLAIFNSTPFLTRWHNDIHSTHSLPWATMFSSRTSSQDEILDFLATLSYLKSITIRTDPVFNRLFWAPKDHAQHYWPHAGKNLVISKLQSVCFPDADRTVTSFPHKPLFSISPSVDSRGGGTTLADHMGFVILYSIITTSMVGTILVRSLWYLRYPTVTTPTVTIGIAVHGIFFFFDPEEVDFRVHKEIGNSHSWRKVVLTVGLFLESQVCRTSSSRRFTQLLLWHLNQSCKWSSPTCTNLEGSKSRRLLDDLIFWRY